MAKYVFKRILSLIPVLFVVSLLVFMMVHMMPGDPARMIAGEQATAEDVERIRVAYGYDRPLYIQYFKYSLSSHMMNTRSLSNPFDL